MTRTRMLELGVEVLLAVFGLAYVYVMLNYPSRAGIVPALVATVMLTALVVQIIREVAQLAVAADDPATSDDSQEFEGLLGESGMDKKALSRLRIIVVWTVVLLVLVQLLGFVLGTALGVLGFLLVVGQPARLALAVAAGIGLAAYALMEHVLKIRWNAAPLLDIIRSWLG